MTKKMIGIMKNEAIDRMKCLNIMQEDIEKFAENGEILKLEFNASARVLYRLRPTETELAMIRQIEEEKKMLVYYMIQDKGIWPDGCTFKRYTLLYVDGYVGDYEMTKEDCIKNCSTVPAYVVNTEIPDCSELCEVWFGNIDGMIINRN